MRSDAYDISAVDIPAMRDSTLRMQFGKADFAYMCMCLDDMLGHRRLVASEYEFDRIKYDKVRGCYPELISTLARDTRLGADLPMLFRYMMESIAGRNTDPNGNQMGMSKTKKSVRLPMRDMSSVISFVVGYANWCPFEPRWHMEYRGDTKRLRNLYPGNVWSYLTRSYMDPAMYDQDVPEHVSKATRRIKGYSHCVEMARHDALSEMRRTYGEEYGRNGRGMDERLRDNHEAVLSMDEVLSGRLPF
jgi:hypothetical protein